MGPAEGISGKPAKSTRQTHHRLHAARGDARMKKPRRGAGLSLSHVGHHAWACRSIPEDSKPTDSTRRRSIGCTAHGDSHHVKQTVIQSGCIPTRIRFSVRPAHEKPRQSGAKSNHEGRRCDNGSQRPTAARSQPSTQFYSRHPTTQLVRWLASRAESGGRKGSANPFNQEPGNSGPNPQGRSEHEGRGKNVCHGQLPSCAKVGERLTGSCCIGAEG